MGPVHIELEAVLEGLQGTGNAQAELAGSVGATQMQQVEATKALVVVRAGEGLAQRRIFAGVNINILDVDAAIQGNLGLGAQCF